MGPKIYLTSIMKMTREAVIPSHSCHDEALSGALYPSLEHFPSIGMDKFLSRHREQLLNDQLKVRRGAQDRVS